MTVSEQGRPASTIPARFPLQGWLAAFVAHPGLWAALLIGLALKAALLLSGRLTFGSDEAILALMARHILRGARPIFYYGQSYMGALDAYLIALSFLLFGQTVLAVRLVQVTLYAGVLITTYLLAHRLSGDRLASTLSALFIALPPVFFSLYTTSTLGDYVEILLLNNLLFLIGWDILEGRKSAAGWWLVAGLLGGLGWWSLPLIVVSLAPLTVRGVLTFRRRMPWGKVGLLVLGFLVGASPWLGAVLSGGGGEVVGFLLRGPADPGLAGDALAALGARLASLVLFNLPALFGLRPPWAVTWIALPVGLLLVPFYFLVVWQAARQATSGDVPAFRRAALGTLLMGGGLLLAIFVLSPFGVDPSGRYLLPLYPLLALFAGDWLGRAWRGSRSRLNRLVLAGLVALCLGYNLWGNIHAAADPYGLTTQFNPITHIPNDHDDDLIAFLDSIGVDRGYANYWVAYRLAFLTGERIILVPRLPYKLDMSYSPADDRYPPYDEAVRQAERIVYVTSNHPDLDSRLGQRFERLGITYRRRSIGPYTVFYDLSRPVTPDELGAFGEVIGEDTP